MTDWVHCNLCFHQPGDGRKFFLTNCGHMYCELCITEGAGERCKICKLRCTTIALSSQMKPDVEMFFTDPLDMLQKHRKQFNQVMDFQKNHRRRFNSYMRDKLAKQKETIEISQKNFQEMERQLIKLKEENAYLKKLISDKGIGGGSRTGTPGNRLSSSPGGYRASPGNHTQNNSPYRQTSNSPASQRHARSYAAEGSKNTPLKPPSSQQMTSKTTPSPMSRLSVRTPPVNGRIGPIPGTPSQRVNLQGKGFGSTLRQSTPGAGEALRHSIAFHLQSPKPMTPGTPHAIQVPITRESQYRHCFNNRVSPGFAIHTPRGGDLLFS